MATPWEKRAAARADTSAPSPVLTGRPDPFKANADARAAEQLRIQQAAEARLSAAASRDAAMTPEQLRALQLANDLKEKELATGGITPTKRAELSGDMNALNTLERGIQSLEQQYQKNFAGKGLQSIAESWAPNSMRPANGTFNDASNQLAAFVAKALGLSGQQFNTPAEQSLFVGSYLPKSSDTDEQIEDKLKSLRSILGNARGGIQQQLGTTPQQNATAQSQSITPATPPPGGTPTTTPQLSGGGGGGGGTGAAINNRAGDRTVTEVDQRLNALANAILARGGSVEEANAAAASLGLNPQSFNPADWAEAQAFNANNPRGQRATVGVGASGVSDPTLMNKVAASPAGSLAFGYLNGVTAGGADEIGGGIESFLTGKPMDEAVAELDLKKRLSAEANPTASLIGNVLGGATSTVGGASLASRFAPGLIAKMGRAAPIVGDALYGTVYGGLENNQDRLGGAALGAPAGAVGGLLGRGTAKAGGGILSGVRGVSQDLLKDRGIKLTLGQTIGGRAKAFEDKVASIPYVGDLIAKRQGESLAGFRKAAFNDLDPRITATGADGIKQAGQVVRQKYGDALDGVNVTPDQPFITGMQSADAAGRAIPGLGDDFGHIMDTRVAPIAGNSPTITGEQAQDMYRVLRNRKSAYGKMDSSGANPIAGDVVDALQGVESNLTGLLSRQAPGAGPALADANRAYAKKGILSDAVMRAEAQGGEFTPYQLGQSSILNTKKFGGKAAAAEGNRPFFDLTNAAQDVLPQKVPNSGTLDRALIAGLIPAALGGTGNALGLIDPTTAAVIAGIGLPYTKTGQRAVTGLMSKRPQAFIDAGEQLAKKARIGGLFGAPLLVQSTQR